MQVITSKRIDAPAKTTWKVLADGFGDIDQWATSIEDAKMKGGKNLRPGVERTCTLAEPRKGQETITEKVVDVQDNAFSYEITDAPGPFLVARNAWLVSEEGDASRVQVISTLIPDGLGAKIATPVIKGKVKKQVKGLLLDLAEHLEEGDEARAQKERGSKARKQAEKAEAKGKQAARKKDEKAAAKGKKSEADKKDKKGKPAKGKEGKEAKKTDKKAAKGKADKKAAKRDKKAAKKQEKADKKAAKQKPAKKGKKSKKDAKAKNGKAAAKDAKADGTVKSFSKRSEPKAAKKETAKA